jgi:malate dehydrogenase
LKAAKGAKGLVEPSYVYLSGIPGGEEIAKKTGVDFFSVPIELGVSCTTFPVSSRGY